MQALIAPNILNVGLEVPKKSRMAWSDPLQLNHSWKDG